jgi:spermidine/putrescine transport system ATP-binding protein
LDQTAYQESERGLASAAGEPFAVELDNVTKQFGIVVAVDDMTLAIEENRFFALLGPSGCGKTTTLRMIGGFEEPTKGTIRLQGQDVTGLKPYRRLANTVFQSYALFPHLSIYENVAFGLRRTKVADAEVKRRVGEMLDLVQLGGMEKRRPRQLSGGQQQRVALARALINHPRVLLLDEPLGALDLKLRKEMQIELKRIQNDVGITFIHVTHDQEEAMVMADTIAVMSEGRIEQLGSPTEIYEIPRSRFVANFLGASNLMRVRVVDARTGKVVMADGTELEVDPGNLDTGDQAGDDEILIGTRPEKIRLARPGEPGLPRNSLEVVVTDASFIGVATKYLVRTAVGDELSAVIQNIGADRHTPGDHVLAAWEPAHTFAVRG